MLQAAVVQAMVLVELAPVQCSMKIMMMTCMDKHTLPHSGQYWDHTCTNLTRFHIFRTLCFFHVFLFFLLYGLFFFPSFFLFFPPLEKACSCLVCPGFDVGGVRGCWNWKVEKLTVDFLFLGWGVMFEWPHSQYITTNMNDYSDGILC